MKQIVRMCALRDATIDDNTIRGSVAVMGNIDRCGACIFPGAFGRGVLKSFLANGFVPVGHEWSTLPVAMPTSIRDAGRDLSAEAVFHSTAAAQDARIVCQERLARGLSVGLSIGFRYDWTSEIPFDDGAALLKYAETNDFDLDLFDVDMVRKYKRPCYGIPKVDELFEFSIVSVPANPQALATDVKSGELEAWTERDFEGFLRDAGFSRKRAMAITSHGFAAATRSERKPVEATEPAAPTVATADPAVLSALAYRHLRARASRSGCGVGDMADDAPEDHGATVRASRDDIDRAKDAKRRSSLIAAFLLATATTRDRLTSLASRMPGEDGDGSDRIWDEIDTSLVGMHETVATIGRQVAGSADPQTDADRALAAAVMAGQREYLSGFRSDVDGGRYTAENGALNTAGIASRLALYVSAALGTANKAWSAEVGQDEDITWHLEDGAAHCAECPQIAGGSPYTADTLPAHPGDGSTECGTNCRCWLSTGDGREGIQID